MLLIFWLILVAVMLVIEIMTMGLTTIWFGLGAAVAAIATYLGAPFWVQVALFSVISIVVMLLVRPFAMKVMDKNRTKTNIDEMLGDNAVVIETIDNRQEQGKVRYRGVEWLARATDSTVIPTGTGVKIEQVSGVKLIVSIYHIEREEKNDE